MKSFQISRYLKKLLPVILIFCVLATYAIHLRLKHSNTYVASEVIHYNDEQAEKGLAPTGGKLDVNEIKSSAVISKVVERMGLTGIYSVDSLISRISITPLPDEDKVAQKEAKLEEGEEYVYEPSTYLVSFAAANSEGGDFARTIIDETLDVYFSEYSQKYVNIAPANNTIENLDDTGYDYIELLELIDTGLEGTLQTLYQRMEQKPYYRATGTGLSFSDLADDFNYIRSVKVSDLFSRVFKYQITKNKSVLLSDYATRIENNNIANVKEESLVNDVVIVMNAYVEKMRESGNTNITYEYILDDLHERNLTGGEGSPIAKGDQTVTYDELVYGWKEHNETKEHDIIDTAYSRYIIDTFQKCTGACTAAECAASDKTCSELHNVYYPQIKEEVDSDLKTLVSELKELYAKTTETNDEYNEYLGASYISVLSSASVKSAINVNLYTLIAFFFLMILCCGGAVVIGRIGDIVDYVFYMDHQTGMYNRAYFDRYLKSLDKKLLDDGVVYCTVDIANLVEINTTHSHQTGDAIIALFAALLKEVFGKADATFVYNTGGSFIILVSHSDYITVEDIMNLFKLRLGERETYADIALTFKVGIAESFRENRSAGKLFAEAIQNKKTYTSAPKQQDDTNTEAGAQNANGQNRTEDKK